MPLLYPKIRRTLRLLLRSFVPMNAIHQEIRRAAQRGDQVALTGLLSHPDCNARSCDHYYGWTALMYAANHGHADCIRLLLPFSDARAQDDQGQTALMWAVKSSHAACIEVLLPASDALTKNNAGHTASDMARESQSHGLARRIDAYVLTLSEKNAVDASCLSGASRNHGSPRL